MGEPVRIVDLAEQMITLSGFKPHEEIPIVFTGVRPGEKIQEVLMNSDEAVSTTRHPKIFIGQINSVSVETVGAAVERLGALARAGREADLRAALGDFLPESKLF
jgi:FlaA1/EpsC-like NDP-sugar epimerase